MEARSAKPSLDPVLLEPPPLRKPAVAGVTAPDAPVPIIPANAVAAVFEFIGGAGGFGVVVVPVVAVPVAAFGVVVVPVAAVPVTGVTAVAAGAVAVVAAGTTNPSYRERSPPSVGSR